MGTKLVVCGNVYLFIRPTSIKGQFQHLSLRSRDGQVKPNEDLELQTQETVAYKAYSCHSRLTPFGLVSYVQSKSKK